MGPPEIAQTLVNIGVDLGKMNTVGDLQGGGVDEAERLLGYKVVLMQEPMAQPAVQIPILKQGAYLIATVQSALTDEDLEHLDGKAKGETTGGSGSSLMRYVSP